MGPFLAGLAKKVGGAALSLGKRFFSEKAAEAAGLVRGLAKGEVEKLVGIRRARKKMALDFARWIFGQSSQGQEEPKTLAQREEAMVNHMSIWLAIGLTFFIMYSFFTNVISNAPIPSGAL